ncbi:MAG: FtsX-like permease family protein [Desulfovermiculus sp.]|nr:FtsX-like permease family protein [Desulfovermiculus sp.]
MDLLLSWRNLWRNPRRTGVILTAVCIGVWSMIFLGSLMRGIVQGMIDNGISTLTGDLLIQHPDYQRDPSVANSLVDSPDLDQAVDAVVPQQRRLAKRIRVSAVASNARHTTGVNLVGIDPEKEAAVSFIGTSSIHGSYLSADDHRSILIGQALAEQFETRPGRKLILMSQNRQGEIASRAYRIQGLFEAEMESTEKGYVFVTRRSAAEMLDMQELISEVSIMLPEHTQAEEVRSRLVNRLPGQDYSIRTWKEALPLLEIYIKIYDGFILIWFVIVFIAMGFGVVNTTLMAVFERMREFGLLKSLGMRPGRIIRMILTESFYILSIGMIAGTGLGITTSLAVAQTGIDISALAQGAEFANISRVIIPTLRFDDVCMANAVVLVLGLAVSLYPAVKAARFSPVEALTAT